MISVAQPFLLCLRLKSVKPTKGKSPGQRPSSANRLASDPCGRGPPRSWLLKVEKLECPTPLRVVSHKAPGQRCGYIALTVHCFVCLNIKCPSLSVPFPRLIIFLWPPRLSHFLCTFKWPVNSDISLAGPSSSPGHPVIPGNVRL